MSGKTVLITGAGTGIGRALAVEADRLGHHLILVGRRRQPLAEVASGLRRASVLPADVTTPQGRALIAASVAQTGLDILINNAGVVPSGAIGTTMDDEIAAALALNVAAPIALTRDLLDSLIVSRGQVVNMGSVFGDIAFPFFAIYSASKFALRGFSDALRRDTVSARRGGHLCRPSCHPHRRGAGLRPAGRPDGHDLDAPEAVAAHAWRAITARRREQLPPTRERLFVALQRLRPALIDRALIRLVRDPAVIAAANHLSSRP